MEGIQINKLLGNDRENPPGCLNGSKMIFIYMKFNHFIFNSKVNYKRSIFTDLWWLKNSIIHFYCIVILNAKSKS